MKNFWKNLAPAVLLTVAAGCYNYAPPALVTEGNTYTKRRVDPRKILPPDTKVVTLELSQELSVVNNPDFESKYHAVQAAWSAYRQRFSGYFPTVTANYGFTQNFDTPTDVTNTSINKTNAWGNSVGLNASLTVFDGLQREMNLLSAKHSALGEEAVREDSRRLLLKAVAEAYNNILLSIENSRIAITDRDFQLKQLKDAQYKYDAGAIPLSDVLNFKVKVNDATSNQISAQYNYNFSRYLLAELIGMPEATLPDDLKYSPIDSIPDEELPDVNIYLDAALNNRPDLKYYRELLQVSKYNLYSKWGAYSPTVSLNGGVGYDTHYTKNLTGSPGHTAYNDSNYNWGVTTQWVLFNGGLREFQIQQAQALAAEAKFNVSTVWIRVIKEVRTAHDTYRQNVKQAKLYRETLSLVTKQRDLVEEEYKAGNKELTRLNEAQRDLVQAETNLVKALVNVMNAKSQLEAATNSNRIGVDLKAIRQDAAAIIK